MMNKLIQMDEKRFMNGPWEVSVKEVAAALQITTDQATTACKPKNEELKARREAAILELHKGGKSNGEIDKSLGLGKDYTRRFLSKHAPQNGASLFGGTQSSPAVLPLANTQDRSDTRVDADPPPFENPEHRTEDATLLSQPLRVPWVCTSAVSDFIRCS